MSENFQLRPRPLKGFAELLVSALLGKRQERRRTAKDLTFKSAISQAEMFTREGGARLINQQESQFNYRYQKS